MTMLRATAISLVLGWAVVAQEPSPSFTVRSDLVYLPTRVETKKGETIFGLQARQFIVEDNGVRQEITVDESPDSTGISMVGLCSAAGLRPPSSTN